MIWDYNRDIVFNDKWFSRWQKPLLFLLNNPSFRIREYTRDKLCIYDDPKLLISRITPNSIHFLENPRDNQREAIFYSYGRNRNRIIIAGDAIWSKIHSFDINFANRFAPALNLGFDTLTAYSTVADGRVMNTGTGGASWATIRNGTDGTSVNTNDTSSTYMTYVNKTTGGGTNFTVYRSFFYYDTSSIGAGTISDGTVTIFCVSAGQSSCSIQKGTQSDTLGTADYDALSGSAYASTANWATFGSRSFTLDATGLSDINKSGTTKYCLREKTKDYDDVEPSGSLANGGYYADNTGNTSDPKLVVTYTAGGAASSIKTALGLNQADIKAGLGIAIAGIKSFLGISNT